MKYSSIRPADKLTQDNGESITPTLKQHDPSPSTYLLYQGPSQVSRTFNNEFNRTKFL